MRLTASESRAPPSLTRASGDPAASSFLARCACRSTKLSRPSPRSWRHRVISTGTRSALSPVAAHLALQSSVTMNSTSSLSTTHSTLPKVLSSRFVKCCAILCLALMDMGATGSGLKGCFAKVQSTKEAMAWPMIAGLVPSTGITRVRNPSATPNSPAPLSSCSSVRGRSFTRGFSEEYTVATFSSEHPSFLSFQRIFEARGSREASDSKPMWSLVGSAFPPAAQHVITLSPCCWQ
mmetsp:Transcript_80183/g.160046  ORF Transcript_80183/g.160046 Transcript_80183/m.160046 type:complete len:236 (-) Transcript_80183:684-1391(-)